MYTVVLTRIESNHNNLRMNDIEGYCDELPVVGETFDMHGSALISTPGYIRLIRTTPVEAVERVSETTYMFRTKNSLYRLTLLNNYETAPKAAHLPTYSDSL